MGRICRGIAISNAIRRKGLKYNYTILHSSVFGWLCDELKINHRQIPAEHPDQLAKNNYQSSVLFRLLIELKPDVLLVDLLWFPLVNFIDKLKCIKIFLCRQVVEDFFKIQTENLKLIFNPENYNHIFIIEPIKSFFKADYINPIVIRNRDEILSKTAAIKALNLEQNKKYCLFAYNYSNKQAKPYIKHYEYLEHEGYHLVYSSLFEGGIFPVADYYNAFDLVICGTGYNAFWETVYFKKNTIYINTFAKFESGKKRITECQNYTFEQNGTDQLLDIITGF